MSVAEGTSVENLSSANSASSATDPMMSRFSAIFHMATAPEKSPVENGETTTARNADSGGNMQMETADIPTDANRSDIQSWIDPTEPTNFSSNVLSTAASDMQLDADVSEINSERSATYSAAQPNPMGSLEVPNWKTTGIDIDNECSVEREESLMASSDCVVTEEFSPNCTDFMSDAHNDEASAQDLTEPFFSSALLQTEDEELHQLDEPMKDNEENCSSEVDDSEMDNANGIESLRSLIDNIPVRVKSADSQSAPTSADGDEVEIIGVSAAEFHSTRNTTAASSLSGFRNGPTSVIVESGVGEIVSSSQQRETSVISRTFAGFATSSIGGQQDSAAGVIPNRIVDPSSQRLQSYSSSLAVKRPLLPKISGVQLGSMQKRRFIDVSPNVVMRGSIPGGGCQVSTMAAVPGPIVSVQPGNSSVFGSKLAMSNSNRPEINQLVASQNPNLNRLLGSNGALNPVRKQPQSVIGPYMAAASTTDATSVCIAAKDNSLKGPRMSPSPQSSSVLARVPRLPANSPSLSYQLPKYHFELPPSYLGDFKIPSEGYCCSECGDSFALKTSLEIHMQRRSVQISVRCLPCDRLLVFYNPCRYKEHVRLHKKTGSQEPIVSPTSYSIRALTDTNVRLEVYATTAYKRISNLSALYSYECPEDSEENPTTSVPPTLSVGKAWSSIGQKVESTVLPRQAPSVGSGVRGTFVPLPVPGLLAMPPAKEPNSLTSVGNVKCSECSLPFRGPAELQLHFAYNLPPTQKQFICTKCQAVYFSSCSYKAHCRIHDSAASGPFICAECGLSLGSMTSLTSHVLTHRLKPCVLDAWRCTKCYTFYSAWEALIAHVAATHCDSFHKCSAVGCAKVFRTFMAWGEHKAADHPDQNCGGESISTCPSCSAVCKDKPQLINHIRKHYAAVSPFQVFRCPLCGRLMENRSGLLTHYRNVHKSNLDPSKMLEYRPQNELTLQQPPVDDVTTPNRQQPTVTAAETSVTPPVRVPSTAPIRSAPVTIAQVNGSQKDQNGTRLPTTAGSTPSSKPTYFNCRFCKNVFFRVEDALKKHMEQTHSHACKTCLKTFETKELRLEDGKKHLREGNPVCLLCENLSFPGQSRLANHLVVHVSGGSFVCSAHCGKKFDDKNEAINHLRAIHSLIVLACEDCGAMMDSEKSLDVHRWVCRQTNRSGVASTNTNGVANKRPIEEGEQRDIPKRMKVDTSPGSQVLPCAKCGAKVSSREEFLRHIKQHQQPGYQQCLECGFCFASEASLSSHLISQHRVADVSNYLRLNTTKCQAVKVPNECDVCHVICGGPSDLTSHMRVHGLRYLKAQEKR